MLKYVSTKRLCTYNLCIVQQAQLIIRPSLIAKCKKTYNIAYESSNSIVQFNT